MGRSALREVAVDAGSFSRDQLHSIFILLLAGALAGCRAPEPLPPYEGPAVTAGARYFTGGILLDASAATGPSPLSADFSPVTVRFISVEDAPRDTGADEALVSKARLLAESAEAPLRPLPGITAGSRVAFGDGAARLGEAIASGSVRRSVEVARLEGCLLSGVTAVFELGGEPAVTTDGRRIEPRVEVHLHRTAAAPGGDAPAGGGEVRVALVVQGRVSPPGSDASGNEPGGSAAGTGSAMDDEPSAAAAVRELVLLDPLPAGEASFLAWLPSPFAAERRESLAAAVEIRAPRRQDLLALTREEPALARTLAELALEGASPAPSPARTGPTPLPGLASALEALGSPLSQRLGILLLARETGARLAEDFALTAGEDLVAKLSRAARLDLSGPTPPDRARTGFVLESRSIETLLEAMSREKLAPGLQTILLVHAGQAGAQAASLEDALRGSDGLETLRERIVEENLAALEDSSPAARVRAVDWLSSRGRVPEGYDPLAPARERRAALEKALEPAPDGAVATPGGTPP
jgi:hypothetical protein